MKFEQGHPKKGGRGPGTPNKATTDIKTRIADLIDQRFDDITDDIDQLEAKDRVTVYLKFLEYILPKQREQKIDLSTRLDGLSDDQLNELIDNILCKP